MKALESNRDFWKDLGAKTGADYIVSGVVDFDINDKASISLTFAAKSFTNLIIRSKWLALLPPGHRQFFSLQNSNGATVAERMLSANNDQITVQMNPDGAAPI